MSGELAHTQARRSATFVLAAVACACVLATFAPAAFAHVPALEPAADPGLTRPISGPEVSRAIYGYLAPNEEYDEYAFTVSEPVTRTVGIIVPAYSEHRDFRPTLLLKGEGDGITTVPDPGKTPRPAEWEPFSLTTFWVGGEREVGFLPGVRYLMRVSPGSGTPAGRYVIVFGGPEAFAASDTAAALGQLPLIWFGAYGGSPWHWNLAALVLLATTAAALVLLGTALWRRFGPTP